jgi:hypothetical protein
MQSPSPRPSVYNADVVWVSVVRSDMVAVIVTE